jgi:hypothetical protein
MEKNKKLKINEVANFLEELSWLLEKKRTLPLKEISSYLRDIENINEYPLKLSSKNDDNKHSRFLVGVLPSLFLDEELFKSRDEILDFAETVLYLPISRSSKRSRTEYIGWIVCEVAKMNDSRLFELVSELENIISDDYKIKEVKKAKKEPNFSWNDTIKKLNR